MIPVRSRPRGPRSGVSAGLLAALAAVALTSAAQRDNAQAVSGRVEIRRDTFGVPHILAADEEAAGFGFGYAMAEDHAAEMGRRYLQARGEAARHFGPTEIQNDLAMQRFDNRRAAARALDQEVGRRFRRWLRGFAAGVNAYVAANRDAVPAWMPAVEPSDPLALGRSAAIGAATRVPARLIEKYPGGVPAPRPGPPVDDPDLREPVARRGRGPAPIDDEPEPRRRVRATAREVADEDVGSNAFALAGSRTVSGRPILLGNPHLPWSSLYWEAHVTVPGRINFYGSTLVGIPILRAGFNDRLGYVQTNNAPDLIDIYSVELDPARPGHFVHDGRPRRIDRRQVAVDVLQPDGTVAATHAEFEDTALGPVIYRTPDHAFLARSAELTWWRHYEGFFELLQARTLAEFQRTLGRGLLVTSNYTYADADGNILYAWNARLPRRPDPAVDYSLDVRGDTPRLFWRGFHRATELPRLVNPAGGYVHNANNAPWWTSLADRLDPARFPPYLERGPLSLRAQAGLAALHESSSLSVDDVRRLKFTTGMLAAERMLPDLLAAGRRAAAPSEALRAGLDALDAWDRRVAAGSRGAVLFERLVSIYERQQAGWFAVPWDSSQPTTTPRGLANPGMALAALERAVIEIREQYGSERVAWGAVNRFRFGDVDLPGDGFTGAFGVYRVVRFDETADGRRVAGHVGGSEPLAGSGDGWVLLVHFTQPVTAWSVLAYGQTTDLASPHSRDQIALFANHELRPVWFSEAAIGANLERRYRPGAASPADPGRR
jgi:acyl-homoserine-lactone acylase